MNPKFTYLFVDLGCILVPLIASFYPKHSFFKQWKYFFPANLLVAFLFLVWDYFFTEAGIWDFNPTYLSGVYILNLPIEEVLFFIAIPYACTFTYFALEYLVKKNPFKKIQSKISSGLIGILSVVFIISVWKWYTSLTFLLMIFFLIYLIIKKEDLSNYYLTYLTIYPFFLVSNGILTGTGIIDEVVWYNNAENLGIRIGTIPIEDSVYGMLLIFLNIYSFKYFREKS